MNTLFFSIFFFGSSLLSQTVGPAGNSPKVSAPSTKPQTLCPHTRVKQLSFSVNGLTFKVSGQTTVKTVYVTLSKYFPEQAQNLRLSKPGKPGWFHLAHRALDEKNSQALFLCAIHEKFGEALQQGTALSLVQSAAPASVAKLPDVAKSDVTPDLSAFFAQLQSSVPTPPALPPGVTSFALTTEVEIGKIAPLLSGVPAGMFVTIGGERAFRGAALVEGLNGLLIFDMDPRTVRFNQINSKLLKAQNLQQYRHLRWDAPFEQWKKHDATLTPEDFKFWRQQVLPPTTFVGVQSIAERLNRNQSDGVATNFKRLHAKINAGETPVPTEKEWYDNVLARNQCAQLYTKDPEKNDFIDAGSYLRYRLNNYLFDEALFQRLRSLAVNNKIFSIAGNLANQDTQDAIIKAFNDFKVPIAVLDLDNGYLNSYLGNVAYGRLVNGLLPNGTNESRLIAMANIRTGNSRYAENQACSHSHYNIYLGFTFDYVRRFPTSIDELSILRVFGNRTEFNKNNWQDIKLFR